MNEKTIEILTENLIKYRDQKYMTPAMNFTNEQIKWLVHEVFERSQLIDFIHVQPMCGPTALAFVVNENAGVTTETVAASTRDIQSVFYPEIDFDQMKETYADTLAADLDDVIMTILAKEQGCVLSDIENFYKFSNPPYQPVDGEYLICSKKFYDDLCEHNENVKKIKHYEVSAVIDQDSFQPMICRGVQKSRDEIEYRTPIFCPYMLFYDQNTTNRKVCKLKMRYGVITGKKEEEKQNCCCSGSPSTSFTCAKSTSIIHG